MAVIWAERALLPGGWARDVRVEVAEGRIVAVLEGAAAEGERRAILLPSPANVHSHAFQRAMAGLTERKGPMGESGDDSFWTWRRLMYRFLDRLDPDQVEAIAAFVQMEMLEAGFSTNVEFHYLHHQPDGRPYARLGEMGERIVAAAGLTGIGLTLLPVHYQYGGLDRRPLGTGQVRFGTDPELYLKLIAELGASVRHLAPDADLGAAPHSLRAVSADGLREVLAEGVGPVHMHLAETVAEVEEVRAATGARPVEWLLANAGVDEGWCLIHCTQMEPRETLALAITGAVAGLCPLTEASLGDGIFDGVRWLGAGGRIGIGSDSNIRISLAEELRQLETSQRLRDHSRAALATEGLSTGRRLWEASCRGGAQAAGRASGAIAEGLWADLVALDGSHVDLEGLEDDAVLDAVVAAGDSRMVTDVWAAGRHRVRDGRHVERELIERAYRVAVRGLREAL
ncbi:MAG TPA: formimidoylglutamate deiminase [Rubellimicrobium sp.]|nr:formimidoylglutamate deiminase [Rubellimicrobium sp.]